MVKPTIDTRTCEKIFVRSPVAAIVFQYLLKNFDQVIYTGELFRFLLHYAETSDRSLLERYPILDDPASAGSSTIKAARKFLLQILNRRIRPKLVKLESLVKPPIPPKSLKLEIFRYETYYSGDSPLCRLGYSDDQHEESEQQVLMTSEDVQKLVQILYSSSCAWVYGEPGIGKTTTVEMVASKHFWDEKASVIRLTITEAGTFNQRVTDEIVRQLTTLRPQYGDRLKESTSNDPDRTGKVFEILALASRETPLAVTIDNLESLPVGHELWGILKETVATWGKGSRLILASRSEPPVMLPGAERLPLAGFTDTEIDAYLTQSLGSKKIRLTQHMEFLTDNLRHLPNHWALFVDWWKKEAFTADALRNFVKNFPVGDIRDYLIHSNLKRMPFEARRLLDRLALLRRPIGIPELEEMASQDGDGFQAGLDYLRAHNIVVQICWFVEVRALFKKVCHQLMSRNRRRQAELRQLHGDAARSYEMLGVADEAAYHYFKSGDRVKGLTHIRSLQRTELNPLENRSYVSHLLRSLPGHWHREREAVRAMVR